MRLGIFLALFVATFVAICSSLITAETYAMNDHSNQVRRLRKDGDVQEERGIADALKSGWTSMMERFTGAATKVDNVAPPVPATGISNLDNAAPGGVAKADDVAGTGVAKADDVAGTGVAKADDVAGTGVAKADDVAGGAKNADEAAKPPPGNAADDVAKPAGVPGSVAQTGGNLDKAALKVARNEAKNVEKLKKMGINTDLLKAGNIGEINKMKDALLSVSKSKKRVWIALSVVLGAVGIGGLYYLIKNMNGEESGGTSSAKVGTTTSGA